MNFNSAPTAGNEGRMASPRRYFSRKFSSRINWKDLPLEKNAMGLYTPAGIFFLMMRLLVPFAYVYIACILLREISDAWPCVKDFIVAYLPLIARLGAKMQKSSKAVEVWVVVEAIFYIVQKWHIQYLQYKDPLEASLSCAPIHTIEARDQLVGRIMAEILIGDPVEFIRGWFFDEELENITRYDVCDFLAWCMFEGRNQEHLTQAEIKQLHKIVEDLEWVMSVHIHGIDNSAIENVEKVRERAVIQTLQAKKGLRQSGRNGLARVDSMDFRMHGLFHAQNGSGSFSMGNDSDSSTDMYQNHASEYSTLWDNDPSKRLKPRKNFRFIETTHDETPVFFSDLYENFKKSHERYSHQLEKLENFASRIQEAEENAKAAAASIYENAYAKMVDNVSEFDKRLHAVNDKMHAQLHEAWNSVWKVTERLETARLVSSRKRTLNTRLKGYQMLLEKTITSNTVPPRQMVDLMKKITQCIESIEAIEHSATNAFFKVTSLDVSHLLQRKEPQRYAKFSEDPLLGLAIYPLVFNLTILGITDGLLRVAMKRRGFERLHVGTTVYYYHPGMDIDEDIGDEDDDVEPLIPIVFCHGIGIGLGYYLHYIDELLKLGHPLFLPEIPYVCGFRPWISRKSILTPHAVVATLTAMLASHGHMKATFTAHSYGTSWISYMCKYSKDTLAAVMFMDPICFCLHHPCLTKSFVYNRADPGSISYMIKTDVIINWTIQRSFPWHHIVVFAEDIPSDIPCSIFISDNDVLIPVDTVKRYLRSKGAVVSDFNDASEEHFSKGPMNVTILRGQAHGDWTESASTSAVMAKAARVLTEQAECGRGNLM